MSSNDVGWGLPIAIWSALLGAVIGVLATVQPSWYCWLGSILWLALTLIAILGQIEPASRAYIAGTLRKPNFTHIYIFTTKRRLEWIWSRVCDPVTDDVGLPATFRAALTWRLYDRTLLIAAAYPILLLLVAWMLSGRVAAPGTVLLFSTSDFWPHRATTLAVLTMLALSYLALQRTWTRSELLERTHSLSLLVLKSATVITLAAALATAVLVPIAVFTAFVGLIMVAVPGLLGSAFAGLTCAGAAVVAVTAAGIATITKPSFAGAYAIAVTTAFAIAAAVAFLFSAAFDVATANAEIKIEDFGAMAFVGAFAAAGSATIAIATAVSATVAHIESLERHALARKVISGTIPVLLLALLVFLPWGAVDRLSRTLFLFLGTLPLVNALFDVLSCAVTLTLLRRGLRVKLPLLYGLIDLGVSLLLFLALAVTLTVVIAMMNRIAGVEIFDLGGLFAGLHTDPHSYWWLYAMVFSTILPTTVHGALSLLGAQGIVPRPVRRWAAALYAGAPEAVWKAALAPIAVGTVWLGPFLVVGAVLWALWWVSADVLAWLGDFYLDTLLKLAVWIGAF